jgi:uroporphyrinogen decarboxylase
MTPKQRLLETLKGNLPDRVPVAPFIQEEFLAWYYPDKPTVDRVVDAVELANELDFDLMAKHRRFEQPHFLRKSHANWEVCSSRWSTEGMHYTRLEIVTPARTLTEIEAVPEAGRATAGVTPATRKHLLESREDVDAFLEYFPPLDEQTAAEMDQTVCQWQAILGDRGVLAPWGWTGVFNFAARLRGIETLMTAPYDDEDLYRVLMDRLATAMGDYNGRFARAGVECIGIQGHMANSNTVSPAYFRKYVLPYERTMVEAIHAAGAATVWHNCGFARSLYANYRELGMTVWETVSEPPRGDNTLADAKAAVGDRICLLGNLDQVDFLKRATPAQVADATRRIVAVGKPGGRYIFAASDFLEKGTPKDNVVAMIEAAKAAGEY